MKEKFYKLDVVDFLDNDETVAEYLNETLKSGDIDAMYRAIGDIARKYSMSKVARDTGLNRSSLYKTLEKGKTPSFLTVYKVLNALNIYMSFNPAVKLTANNKQIKEKVS